MATREINANVAAQLILNKAIDELNAYCNELARDGQGFNPDLTAAYHCLFDARQYVSGKPVRSIGLNSGLLQFGRKALPRWVRTGRF